jgi:hypothetical protein
LGERRWVARLADGDEACPQAFGSLEFGFGFGAEADVGASSAPRQERQRSNGGLGAAKLIDEGAEGGGPHIFASDQSEPSETLMMVQARRGLGRS